jgi:hypothetical protein
MSSEVCDSWSDQDLSASSLFEEAATTTVVSELTLVAPGWVATPYTAPEAESAFKRNGAVSPVTSKANLPPLSGVVVRTFDDSAELFRDTDVTGESAVATPVTACGADTPLGLLDAPQPSTKRVSDIEAANDRVAVLIITLLFGTGLKMSHESMSLTHETGADSAT